MRIAHDAAAAIALAMFDAGIEGAETLLIYIDEQSNCAELTDRELTLRAWRRADEAAHLCADVQRRVASLERRVREV
jgi:predicted NBD/HSP70 family sugar kinase